MPLFVAYDKHIADLKKDCDDLLEKNRRLEDQAVPLIHVGVFHILFDEYVTLHSNNGDPIVMNGMNSMNSMNGRMRI